MKNKLNYILGILIILTAIIWSAIFQRASDQNFHLYLLDIGQGMAIYVRFPNGQDLLYDGGPDETVLQELGEVMPAWDRQIDYIVSSHNHSDHLVGLIAVLEKYQVGQIWLSGAIHTTETYQRFLEAIDENGAKIKIVYVNQSPSIKINDTDIKVLSPLTNLTDTRPENQNNASVALRLDYGQTSILLPGEVEKEAEAEIVDLYCLSSLPCNPLDVDILQSPHQGSKSSSTLNFLQAVNPEIALIAVGADNKYGHPHKEVLDRYQSLGIDYLRTDQCGRIEVIANLENYWVKTKNHHNNCLILNLTDE